MNRKIPLPLLLLLFATAAAGCEGSNPVFVDHLAVININPSHGAVSIGYDTDVTVTFSEVLSVQTVSSNSICLIETPAAEQAAPADPENPCASSNVLASVTYDAQNLTARLQPGELLNPDMRYTLFLTTAIEGDPSGRLPAVVRANFRTTPTFP